MTTAELIYKRAQSLPEPLVREVLDFLEFVVQKSEHAETENLMRAQQPVLTGVWDNAEDEAWNHADCG